ncbi:MAG TPA: type VI secretion system protein TssA [Verrucomicrobiae bacterium]
MNELIEALLKPVSAEQPCGPDLSYDGRFDELETLLKGKREIDIGNIKRPAEPPDWRELQQKAAAFLKDSKHLRIAMMFCCSLLQTRGLAGFRDGLQLLHGLVEKYWGALYPLLDPEDNNDPTARLNMLSALTAPRGSVTGWMTFMDYLHTTALCQPRGAAAVTFEQIQNAKLGQTSPEGAAPQGPTLAALTPVLRAGAAQIAESHGCLKEALEAVQGMDRYLTSTLSAGKTMSFDELEKTLQAMLTALQPYLPVPGGDGGETAEAASTPEASTVESPGSGIVISGSIRSREDVVKALEKICQYYDQVEPGSPVPYLLRRAQKLANMNFVQAVQELNLVTDTSTLRPSMGSTVESSQPPPQPDAST